VNSGEAVPKSAGLEGLKGPREPVYNASDEVGMRSMRQGRYDKR
jgi:hypothetical protein